MSERKAAKEQAETGTAIEPASAEAAAEGAKEG
jgi:hypothetical protein